MTPCWLTWERHRISMAASSCREAAAATFGSLLVMRLWKSLNDPGIQPDSDEDDVAMGYWPPVVAGDCGVGCACTPAGCMSDDEDDCAGCCIDARTLATVGSVAVMNRSITRASSGLTCTAACSDVAACLRCAATICCDWSEAGALLDCPTSEDSDGPDCDGSAVWPGSVAGFPGATGCCIVVAGMAGMARFLPCSLRSRGERLAFVGCGDFRSVQSEGLDDRVAHGTHPALSVQFHAVVIDTELRRPGGVEAEAVEQADVRLEGDEHFQTFPRGRCDSVGLLLGDIAVDGDGESDWAVGTNAHVSTAAGEESLTIGQFPRLPVLDLCWFQSPEAVQLVEDRVNRGRARACDIEGDVKCEHVGQGEGNLLAATPGDSQSGLWE